MADAKAMERERLVGAMARAIYGAWAKIEGAETTYDQMVERLVPAGYPNAKKFHRMAIEEAGAALAALSAAGFAVVPVELAKELEPNGWDAVRPYHDISTEDIFMHCPRDFWRLGWRRLVRATDLARTPDKEDRHGE